MAPAELYIKHRADAPRGFFSAEVAGLAWLAEARPVGGVRIAAASPVSPNATQIELELIPHRTPTAANAWEFGIALARTHASGAPHHGALPPGTPSGPSFIATLPLPLVPAGLAWGEFYARYRIEPFLRPARDRGALSAAQTALLAAVAERVAAGQFPDADPSRLHGDLWSGNVLWSPEVVLIDPSAHGGHLETDLAMLELFGLPLLDDVLAGYQSHTPFTPGRNERVALHQLYPLLVHAVLFGGSYGAQAAAAAKRYL